MFLGHKNDLADGELKSLPIFENTKSLCNNKDNYQLTTNICPHQNSRIIAGVKSELKCQYHGWSWNLDGEPLSSGNTKACNNFKLQTKKVHEYRGLLFEEKVDLKINEQISFHNLVCKQHRIDDIDADPKVVMDIFLDVDHIPVVHKGVYDLLGIDEDASVTWSYNDWGSVQTVTDKNNTIVAVWIAIYPYTMIEWQSGCLFVSRSLSDKKIAVWKYKDKNISDEIYETNSTMWETAFEQDKFQASQIVNFPKTKFLEEAKVHYREWLKNATIA
jgi:phenylpropionate dioxygenase-like ring-hydroxylating dioxygenase large terminal subunit